MRMLCKDKDGNIRFIAMGDSAPTLACFLAGMLLGSLIALLVK